MMLNKRILAISITILAFAGLAFADAGPEPGYIRIGAPLIVTPQDDFDGYRFFLDSPGGFEEIKLAKGKTTTISTEGRAGSMKYTTLIAISNRDLGGAFDGPATPETMDALQAAIRDKKVNGVIELVSHDFDAYIKKKEKKTWKNPTYVLKASADKKIEAVETKPAGKKKGEVEGEDGENSHMAADIAAGSLLSLSFIFGGVWFSRRKRDSVRKPAR
jgi:hypothetical protein